MQTHLAWGKKVSGAFRTQAFSIAAYLGVEADDLMSCMAFESGETFSPSIKNAAGSGAVGLIQFMPQTLAAMGRTTDEVAAMSAESQINVVEDYFSPRRGKLRNLGDLYSAIIWPAAIGRPDDWVMFDQADPAHPKLYLQNRGLDFNKDGKITRGEACAAVLAKRQKGMLDAYRWDAIGVTP